MSKRKFKIPKIPKIYANIMMYPTIIANLFKNFIFNLSILRIGNYTINYLVLELSCCLIQKI